MTSISSRLETAQITILDQVVGMTMMPIVADVHADVVQKRGILEPFPFPIAEAVDAPRLIEDAQREPRHLLGVLGPVAAALAEFDDAAAPDVGIRSTLRIRARLRRM